MFKGVKERKGRSYKKMFKGVEKRKGRNYMMSTWLKVNVKISPCPKSTTYSRSAIFLCQKSMA